MLAGGFALRPAPFDEFPVVNNPFGVHSPVVALFGDTGMILVTLLRWPGSGSSIMAISKAREGTGMVRAPLELGWKDAPCSTSI
jgi:hypothetical protein